MPSLLNQFHCREEDDDDEDNLRSNQDGNVFSEMKNSDCRLDVSVYNALITAHLHTRDKAKALEKVHQVNALFKDLDMSVASPDVYTFNGVMDAYGKNGMIKEMETVLTRMRSNEYFQEFDAFQREADSAYIHFNSMIINYGKARLKDKAEWIFEKMNDMNYMPSFITYECMIMMYGYCGSVSRGREIFEEVVKSDRILKTSTLNAMLDVYYMKENVQMLMKKMEKDGIVPNKIFFFEALEVFGSRLPSSDSVNRKSTDPSTT
ncbi:unnamed protein product [Cochlearia groenlandica]